MPELILTSAQRQALKARAHGLRPVVLLGAAGLTERVVQEIDRALAAHALIKIKVPTNDRSERTRMAADVATKLSAANVQSIGKMIVLFRPQPESEEKQGWMRLMHRQADKRRHRLKIDAQSAANRALHRSADLKTRYTKQRRSNIRARRQVPSPLQYHLHFCRLTHGRLGSTLKSSPL